MPDEDNKTLTYSRKKIIKSSIHYLCWLIFCEDLNDHANKIINYEKKEMAPLTNEEKESYENQKICHICEKEFCYDEDNKKEFRKIQKVRDHCH